VTTATHIDGVPVAPKWYPRLMNSRARAHEDAPAITAALHAALAQLRVRKPIGPGRLAFFVGVDGLRVAAFLTDSDVLGCGLTHPVDGRPVPVEASADDARVMRRYFDRRAMSGSGRFDLDDATGLPILR
jgi:hypothetical protein